MTRNSFPCGAVAFELTARLFFDQASIDAMTTTVSPYRSREIAGRNAQDHNYRSATQRTLAGDRF